MNGLFRPVSLGGREAWRWILEGLSTAGSPPTGLSSYLRLYAAGGRESYSRRRELEGLPCRLRVDLLISSLATSSVLSNDGRRRISTSRLE